MSSLATALENLAAVSVSGVTSYALDETPGALARAQCPALLILPELGGDWPGLEPNRFVAGAGDLVVRIAHVLLVAPVIEGACGALPALVDLIDAYVEAIAADPLLGEALAVPLRVAVRAGVVHYAGVDYHGATFLHTWTLRV